MTPPREKLQNPTAQQTWAEHLTRQFVCAGWRFLIDLQWEQIGQATRVWTSQEIENLIEQAREWTRNCTTSVTF